MGAGAVECAVECAWVAPKKGHELDCIPGAGGTAGLAESDCCGVPKLPKFVPEVGGRSECEAGDCLPKPEPKLKGVGCCC